MRKCECHPGKKLKGRLINHSMKSFNSSVVQHGDQLIILFMAGVVFPNYIIRIGTLL